MHSCYNTSIFIAYTQLKKNHGSHSLGDSFNMSNIKNVFALLWPIKDHIRLL